MHIRPLIDGEPLYEDHPITFDAMAFGFSADWHIRWLRHTYGCHNIWQMYTPGRTPISWTHHCWYEPLGLWGTADMMTCPADGGRGASLIDWAAIDMKGTICGRRRYATETPP
jgi:hypothetical protein